MTEDPYKYDHVVCPKCGKRNIELLYPSGEWECYDCGIEFIITIKESTKRSIRSTKPSILSNHRPPTQGCPHTPTKRVVLPAPRKSKLTFDQIQDAVRKVSKKNRNKL